MDKLDEKKKKEVMQRLVDYARPSNEEAQAAIDAFLAAQAPVKQPEPQPEVEQTAQSVQEDNGLFQKLFGGKSTRQKQLEELERKARGV